jgi:branched-chain amino acid transport system ATP-binding protein
MSLLRLEKVLTRYGAITAIRDINFFIDPGEIVTLIGANGAGKSTTMKTISGLLKHSEGTIEFQQKRIDHVPGHDRVKLGIVLVPEGRDVFAPLTVDENLRMGAYLLKSRREIKENKEKVFQLFPRLRERIQQQAGTLSGGEQQMLAMGRALMTQPALLMLDEPSLGLAPNYIELIFSIIQQINEQGVTILLVEQNAKMALMIAKRGYVLETGNIILHDATSRLLEDQRVRKAYLGA